MHYFTFDFLLIIASCHGKLHSRYSHTCFLVDFFSVPIPSLATNIPLKPRRWISPISHALHLYSTARSGHKRTSKWWGFSWDSQVDRSWWGWKYYSWVIRFLQNCPIFNFFSWDEDIVRRTNCLIIVFGAAVSALKQLRGKRGKEFKHQSNEFPILLYLKLNFSKLDICIIELCTLFN